MNRRSFLKSIAAVPFVGLISKPTDNNPDLMTRDLSCDWSSEFGQWPDDNIVCDGGLDYYGPDYSTTMSDEYWKNTSCDDIKKIMIDAGWKVVV